MDIRTKQHHLLLPIRRAFQFVWFFIPNKITDYVYPKPGESWYYRADNGVVYENLTPWHGLVPTLAEGEAWPLVWWKKFKRV